MIPEAPFEILWQGEHSTRATVRVSVIITCYRYGKECREALDSLCAQTEPCFDVIVVDDCSPDDSAARVQEWMAQHEKEKRFRTLKLLRHHANQGLSQARNTALAQVRTPYVFVLDADNLLYPRCLKVLREALEHSGAQMAYSLIECFGGEQSLIGNELWQPERFAFGNYIDAMAMIRVSALEAVGGYRRMPYNFGWEDYDLWCAFVDRGFVGCHVPQILCRYRVHGGSMLRNVTNPYVLERVEELRADMEKHHSFKFYF
ncbi:MAG: glycosyltransferase [Methylohalobius sp.]|nr:glycosyltransferase [Methylohalobius sp.]